MNVCIFHAFSFINLYIRCAYSQYFIYAFFVLIGIVVAGQRPYQSIDRLCEVIAPWSSTHSTHTHTDWPIKLAICPMNYVNRCEWFERGTCKRNRIKIDTIIIISSLLLKNFRQIVFWIVWINENKVILCIDTYKYKYISKIDDKLELYPIVLQLL